jgi:putative tryptophan/tyrosine transport system substrate-binding protein
MDRQYSRRQVVQSVGAVGLGLLAACGRWPWQGQQPAKVPRIGYLSPFSPQHPFTEAFQDGLREHGYVEGENIAVEYRFARDSTERLPDLAADLVSLRPDVLVVVSTLAARAAKAATSTIPIVMGGGDPIATGLVVSLAHPGGNLTGVSNIAPELSGKRLQLLKEAVPGTARAAAIWNAPDPVMALEFGETLVAAKALGVELMSIGVRERADLERAYEAATDWRADAIILIADQFVIANRVPLVSLSAQSGLPTISGDGEFAAAGGLMAYGPNRRELHRRVAQYVDKVLKGTKPADLPVERPMTFEFVINLRTAQTLGLTIPQHVLLQATEVIQ